MLKAYISAQTWLESVRSRLLTARDDESGAALVEYALLIGLMAAAVIATVPLLKTSVNTAFVNVGTRLTTLQ
jgi:Flp pilus assembly pilin Flp